MGKRKKKSKWKERGEFPEKEPFTERDGDFY